MLQRDVAVGAWRELLEGRFRLLDRWCAFVTDKQYYQLGIVTEDTWAQVRTRTHHCARLCCQHLGAMHALHHGQHACAHANSVNTTNGMWWAQQDDCLDVRRPCVARSACEAPQ